MIFYTLFTLFSVINKNMYSIKWIFISHRIYQKMVAELGKDVCGRMVLCQNPVMAHWSHMFDKASL